MQAAVLVAYLSLASPEAEATLKEADAALADFRPEDALALLQKAKAQGPHRHADHVKLYESLGIAHAYLEKNEAALEAFRVMLALDPARAISYTLSPKVTFVFEEARKRAAERPAPGVDLAWPRDLQVDLPVPIDIEVLADPEGFLKRGRLYFRQKGAPAFDERSLPLPAPASPAVRIELPPPNPLATDNQTLEIYLVAQDDAGNETLLFGSPKRPREITLTFVPPDPWYGRWWIWAIAGTVVAVGAGTAVFAATREPPDRIDGTFEVMR
jgi:tetratricopeptide (TPR) repeat protein